MAFSFKRKPKAAPVKIIKLYFFDEATEYRRLVGQWTDLVALMFDSRIKGTDFVTHSPELERLTRAALRAVEEGTDKYVATPSVYGDQDGQTYYSMDGLCKVADALALYWNSFGRDVPGEEL